jgi:hypothetical protein
MSKRFGPLLFKGSTQAKRPFEIFRFGYAKALNDKMVPDPVGSARFLYYINSLGSHWFVRQKQGFALNPTRIIRRGRSAANYDDESSSDAEELLPAAFCQIGLVSVD